VDLRAGWLNIALLLDGGPAGWRALGGKKKKKKKHSCKQVRQIQRVNEKLFSMEDGQKKMHLCMDSSTSLVRSSLRRLVFLFVSMNKSTKQKGYEHKLTCKEKGKHYAHILKKIE
jgi:hypothetical protein